MKNKKLRLSEVDLPTDPQIIEEFLLVIKLINKEKQYL